MEFLSDAMYWVLKVLGVLTLPLIALSAVMMVRSVRKQQRMKIPGLVLQACSPLIVLMVYSLLLPLEPPGWLVWLLLIGGLALGIGTSRTVDVRMEGDALVSSRSPLFVIVWAATLLLTQTLAVVTNAALAGYAFATMYFAIGLALGLNVALIVRGKGLKPVEAVSSAAARIAPPRVTCPTCGASVPANAAFCPACGTPITHD